MSEVRDEETELADHTEQHWIMGILEDSSVIAACAPDYSDTVGFSCSL